MPDPSTAVPTGTAPMEGAPPAEARTDAGRRVCVHGHFYQPPRENPWLEAVEVEDSAQPYHDWNARIAAECYAPNGASRVLDADKRILRIRNNYRRMSFNIGPTLAEWLERSAPEAYERILDADRSSRAEHAGHGNAIAQVYNHMILPLANRRDKETQVRWGIADFRRRFGRDPEGMWLPETAVDTETLEVLAAHGIAFTILAPHQAVRTRVPGHETWADVSGGRIDPHRPYRCALPSGTSIALFFYDGGVSHDIAFAGLLDNGDTLAARLVAAFAGDDSGPQLVHAATDGESYGHHHAFGEMALTRAFEVIRSRGDLALANYGEVLAQTPPDHEVQIAEPTSWSCAHGVERWRSNCGCRGGHPEWSQEWRRPLRETLDWLREQLARVFEEHGPRCLRDPWAARNAYIEVILNRSPEALDAFFAAHGAGEAAGAPSASAALRLLEMQRHAMLMYTSCGWFFDDISGIETVQVIKYAARALQLAEGFGARLEDEFTRRLGGAKSNVRQWRDGTTVYRRAVRPSFVTLPRVVAHYGISSLFETYEDVQDVFCFTVWRRDALREDVGGHALAVGLVTVTSSVTAESSTAAYAVLHLGGHDIQCGVRADVSKEWYEAMKTGVAGALAEHGASAALRMLDAQFGGSLFGLRDLFKEERRKILGLLIEERLGRFEGVYDALYEQSRPLITFMRESDVLIPPAFRMAAEETLTRRMIAELRAAETQPLSDRAFEIASEMDALDLTGAWADAPTLLREAIESRAERLRRQPLGEDLDQVHRLLDLADALGVTPNLWQTQNAYHTAALTHAADLRETTDASDRVGLFWRLGERLHFNLDALRSPG
jgi:alpha-amylase/alpha-mannosidase (GH57 family)